MSYTEKKEVSIFELLKITKKDALKWLLIALVVGCLYLVFVFSANTVLANYGYTYNPNFLTSTPAFFSNLAHFFKWITSSFSSFSSYLEIEENLNYLVIHICFALLYGNVAALLLLQKRFPVKKVLIALIVSTLLLTVIIFALNRVITPAMGAVPCDPFAVFYRVCYYPDGLIRGFDFNLTNALILLGILTAILSAPLIYYEKNWEFQNSVSSTFHSIKYCFEKFFTFSKWETRKWIKIAAVVSCLYFLCVFSTNTTLANYGYKYSQNYLSSASAFFSHFAHFFKWITLSFSSFVSFLKVKENLIYFVLQICYALIIGNVAALLLRQEDSSFRRILLAFVISIVSLFAIAFACNRALTPAMGKVACDPFAVINRLRYYPDGLIKGYTVTFKDALIACGVLTAVLGIIFVVHCKVTEERRHFYKYNVRALKRTLKRYNEKEKEIKKYYVDPSEFDKATVIDSSAIPTVEQMFTMNDDEVTKILNGLDKPVEEEDLSKECVGVYIKKIGE